MYKPTYYTQVFKKIDLVLVGKLMKFAYPLKVPNYCLTNLASQIIYLLFSE